MGLPVRHDDARARRRLLVPRLRITGGRMTSEGTKLRKIREAELQRRDKVKLRAIDARLKRAQAERRHALQQIAHYCRLGRQNVSARVRHLREELRDALKAKASKLREAQRGSCAADRREAQREYDVVVDAARRELEQQKASMRAFYGPKRARSSAKERREESDHEVSANLPPELVPVFEHVKKSIRPRPRMSRTETFLHWAEEHPDDVHAIMYEAAERDVARLVAEHERVRGRLRKGKRAYRDPEELAHALSGVPF